MSEKEILAEQFEANRAYLRAVAYRILGSVSEAEDAVQDAWLRLTGGGAGEVGHLRGWLTTTVARISLDMLRARPQEALGAASRPRSRGTRQWR